MHLALNGLVWWEVFVRLCLAVVLGGLIGIERESVEKPAGFRTHILVCVGAALFTLVSREGFFGSGADPARVAANIVVGIGFLGAGTIWRSGATVQGLTTAASLWTVAAIGTSVGAGYYFGAVVTTGIVGTVLVLFKRIEVWFPRRGITTLNVLANDRPGLLGRIGTILGAYAVNIEQVNMDERGGNRVNIAMAVRVPSRVNRERLLIELSEIDGMVEVHWEE